MDDGPKHAGWLVRVYTENKELKAEVLRLKVEVAQLEVESRRRWQDRYDALNVKSRDGLLSSEWILRTGIAERERDEAVAEADLLRAQLALVHHHVDLTNPRCPIGVALTKAGCPRIPRSSCHCIAEAADVPACPIHHEEVTS